MFDDRVFLGTVEELKILTSQFPASGDAEFYRTGSLLYLNSKLFVHGWQRDIEAFARRLKRGSVLDLGCGIGYLSVFLSAQGYTCFGIDVGTDVEWYVHHKPQQERVAWRNQFWKVLQANFEGVNLQLYDGCTIPYGDNLFDAVVAYAVIEHILASGLGELIDQVYRVLKPGGVLFIACTPRKQAILEHLSRWLRLGEHLVLMDEKELSQMLSRHGFEILSIERTHMLPCFPERLINPLYPFLATLDDFLLRTPLNYFAHHMRVFARKSA